MSSCPFCGCDRIYPLLDTLRCKRCKGIWKLGADVPASQVSGRFMADSLKCVTKRDSLGTRLEKMLDTCLHRPGGRYCHGTTAWQDGDIPEGLFLTYLAQCVRNGTLQVQEDCCGRIWYFRPGRKSRNPARGRQDRTGSADAKAPGSRNRSRI